MSSTTPNLGLFKYNTSTDGKEVFSIQTALNNNWDILDERCGSQRNIGEIVASTIPLTDSGLHLLDGALIDGSGIYSEFVDYIAGLHNIPEYWSMFTTEAIWQDIATSWGYCGKFVYDSENNTVRLPKIGGFLEGTLDPSLVGDLIGPGLPNITGGVTDFFCGGPTGGRGTITGAFSASGSGHGYGGGGSSGVGFDFDASRSSWIYGNSDTVHPQSIKVLYYVVVATSTKTDIQVDIDEIVTDLNGKADVDLTNCTKPHIVETYQNGTSWYRVYSDGWCEQGGYFDGNGTTYNLYTMALLKNYVNTDYSIFTEIYNEDFINGVGPYYFGVHNKTTSSFQFYSDVNIQRRFWKTCGYIR